MCVLEFNIYILSLYNSIQMESRHMVLFILPATSYSISRGQKKIENKQNNFCSTNNANFDYFFGIFK